MPKPLNDVDPGGEYSFQRSAFTRNKRLSPLIAISANTWTSLELQLGKTLAHFLHAQPEIGIAIYSAINSLPMKRNIVLMAGKQDLDPMEQKVLAALLTETAHLYDERIKVEHGCWGYSNAIRNGLLRARPSDLLEVNVIYQQQRNHPQSKTAQRDGLLHPVIEVWYEEDFTTIIDRMDLVIHLFNIFRVWLDKTQTPESHGIWHHQLCRLPRIQEILSPSPKARRSASSMRPQSPDVARRKK